MNTGTEQVNFGTAFMDVLRLLLACGMIFSLSSCGGRAKNKTENPNPLYAAREAWAHTNIQAIAEAQWPEMGPSRWPATHFEHADNYWAVDSVPRPYELDWDEVRFVFHSPSGTGRNRLVGVFSYEPHGYEELFLLDENPGPWLHRFAPKYFGEDEDGN